MDASKPLTAIFGEESLRLKLGTIALPCYILEDGTRAFTKDGVQKAMGYEGKSEDWLFEFLTHLTRLTTIDPDLLEALSVDLRLETQVNQNTKVIKKGIEPWILIQACQAIQKAKDGGFLFVSELKFAKAADTILQQTNNLDVEKLIDFATGFDLFKQNHKEALYRFMKQQIHDHYPIWIRTFPDGFYEKIFQFKQWQWRDLNDQAPAVAAFFLDAIFARIDDALFERLNSEKPKMTYRKTNVLEQYLEHPGLQAYRQSLLGLLKTSEENDNLFQVLLNNTFPKKRVFANLKNFPKKKAADVNPSLFLFNENLKKTIKSVIPNKK